MSGGYEALCKEEQLGKERRRRERNQRGELKFSFGCDRENKDKNSET